MTFTRIHNQLEAISWCNNCPDIVAIDTEYVKGDPRTTALLEVVVADESRAWAFPAQLLPVITPTLRARKLVFLQDYRHCDTVILLKHGCDLRETQCVNLIDTHHLIDENVSHSLDERCKALYNDDYKSVFWSTYSSFESAPEDVQLEYMCKDAIYTYRLGMRDLAELERQNKIELYNHVRNTSKVLLETELRGILVDVPLLMRTKNEVEGKIHEYLPQLRKEFRYECNIWEIKKWTEKARGLKTDKGRSNTKRPQFSFNSDKQVAWLLYEQLNLPVINKTKAGNPSVDVETLQRLGEEHPRIQPLVKYFETISTYDGFIKGIAEKLDNSRIYPNFNTAGTKTGRLSHTNPNMANLPTEGTIRNFFLPDPGYVLVGADYSQLEVVIELNLTEDAQLKKIVQEGASKHDITAQGLGVDRKTAKTLNFGLQYLCGEFKVGKILGCCQCDASTYYRSSRKTKDPSICNCGGMVKACEVYNSFWKLYSGSKTKIDEVEKILQAQGEVTNLFGRTRRFECKDQEPVDRRALRQAYNFLVQGPAGDACNRALWKIAEALKENNWGQVMFSVHDEIILQVKPEVAEEAKLLLCKTMEEVSTFLKLKYPLTAKAYGPLTFWSKT